jgi:hypothetical protein
MRNAKWKFQIGFSALLLCALSVSVVSPAFFRTADATRRATGRSVLREWVEEKNA